MQLPAASQAVEDHVDRFSASSKRIFIASLLYNELLFSSYFTFFFNFQQFLRLIFSFTNKLQIKLHAAQKNIYKMNKEYKESHMKRKGLRCSSL